MEYLIYKPKNGPALRVAIPHGLTATERDQFAAAPPKSALAAATPVVETINRETAAVATAEDTNSGNG